MKEQKELLISVELGYKEVMELTNELLDLMVGSVDMVGCGMAVGGSYRDLDIIADTQEELDDYIEILSVKGYKFEILKNE